jgi:transcriptional regulator with XRE-family HTH domain
LARKSVLFDPLTLGKRAQRIRIEKGISIEVLSKAASVNKNTVVRFEKGIPTRMDTIYKICNVLEVSPLQLVEGKLVRGRDYDIQKHKTALPGQTPAKPVTRAERVQTDLCDGMRVGDLNYHLPGGRLSARVMEIHGRSIGKKKTHPGEELLFCLTGKIGIEISDVRAILKKGDAIFFWGTEPHCYFNADENKSKSVALSVVYGE